MLLCLNAYMSITTLGGSNDDDGDDELRSFPSLTYILSCGFRAGQAPPALKTNSSRNASGRIRIDHSSPA